MEPEGIIEVSTWRHVISSLKIYIQHDIRVLTNSFFFLLQSNWNEITDNFDDMSLKETLLRGIYAYGFEKPSAIQQRAIIPCIKGTDTYLIDKLTDHLSEVMLYHLSGLTQLWGYFYFLTDHSILQFL